MGRVKKIVASFFITKKLHMFKITDKVAVVVLAIKTHKCVHKSNILLTYSTKQMERLQDS